MLVPPPSSKDMVEIMNKKYPCLNGYASKILGIGLLDGLCYSFLTFFWINDNIILFRQRLLKRPILLLIIILEVSS